MNYITSIFLFFCLTITIYNGISIATPSFSSKTVSSIELNILIDNLRVRVEPNSKAKVIAKISNKNKVIWTGETSSHQDAIKLRGVKFKTPWIKINTTNDQTGWIYAAAANTDGSANNLSEKFTLLRTESFFGEALANQMAQYRKNYHEATTAKLFAEAYQLGQTIRDTSVDILEKKALVEFPKQMDMSWLEIAMPGYKLSVVAEGTQYYLFANFKKMRQIAEASEDSADENFLQLATNIYASDEEGFFHAWFQQTWDYGGESLLGQGKHIASLKTMTDFSKNTNLFNTQIVAYTDALIHDISNKGKTETNTVKESKINKTKELNEMLELNSPVLNEKDIQIIKDRITSILK